MDAFGLFAHGVYALAAYGAAALILLGLLADTLIRRHRRRRDDS